MIIADEARGSYPTGASAMTVLLKRLQNVENWMKNKNKNKKFLVRLPYL